MLDTAAEITCAHCWETFTMQVDPGAPQQTLVYDCQVCCNPLEISYRIGENGVDVLSVEPVQ